MRQYRGPNFVANQGVFSAYENGVKMAFGTDAGVFPHGDNAKEFASLVARDLPEEHVLRMATIYAAGLLGVDDRGIIAAGKRADLVAVPGNPLEDISVLRDPGRNLALIMKGGEVVVGRAP